MNISRKHSIVKIKTLKEINSNNLGSHTRSGAKWWTTVRQTNAPETI